MSENVYTSAVVLIPPPEAFDAIQSIRRRFDSKAARWMPHITLLYPFWPRARFSEARGLFEEVSRRHQPWTMSLERFDHFPAGRGLTGWLDPQPAGPLITLQDELRQAAGEPPPKRPFKPHLTIGRWSSAARGRGELADLQAAWTPRRFAVEELALISRPEAGPFETIARLRLGQ